MKKNIVFLVFTLLSFIAVLVFTRIPVVVATTTVVGTWGVESANPSVTPRLENPLKRGGVETPQDLIGKIINSVLGVVGSLALLMFVFGGITWMTSSGNKEKIQKGRDIIVWAAIGLVIVFSAYGLTRVLLEGVTK